MADGLGGLNRNSQLTTCPCCLNFVIRLELKPQDGTLKCRTCRRRLEEVELDEILDNTNAAMPVLVKFGGKTRRFRQ